MVLRRCRKLLRDEDEALDAMQDTFVQLVRHHRRLQARGQCSLLYRMATNICLNRLRSDKRRRSHVSTLLCQVVDSCEEGRLADRSSLRTLFSREKPSTQVIAVLHLHDGLTLAEVAHQVGLSVSGVRKRLARVRRRLAALREAPTPVAAVGTVGVEGSNDKE